MALKLTQEEFEQRVFNCVGNKYKVISTYEGKRKPVKFLCNIHNIEFEALAECFMRGAQDVRAICPQCWEERRILERKNFYTKVKCAYCGKDFDKKISSLSNSKSGLYFCCREHKDLAQRIESGQIFSSLRPSHYGKDIIMNYRKTAFEVYPHKCFICGWDEDEDILEVHHLNENHSDNRVENLRIICPTCHRKITLHKYKLENNKLVLI